jgi:hypothetical protein
MVALLLGFLPWGISSPGLINLWGQDFPSSQTLARHFPRSSPLTASSAHEAYAVEKATSPRKADSGALPRTASSSNSVNASTGVSWKAEYTSLAHEIQVRHYCPKTLRTYTQWMRHFQTFTKSKDPRLLSSSDVKEFLTFLAVTRKVSASS